MAEARSRDEWGHTSSIIAHVASQNSKKPRHPSEFNPWLEKTGKPGRAPLSVGLLKAAYVDKPKPVK